VEDGRWRYFILCCHAVPRETGVFGGKGPGPHRARPLQRMNAANLNSLRRSRAQVIPHLKSPPRRRAHVWLKTVLRFAWLRSYCERPEADMRPRVRSRISNSHKASIVTYRFFIRDGAVAVSIASPSSQIHISRTIASASLGPVVVSNQEVHIPLSSSCFFLSPTSRFVEKDTPPRTPQHVESRRLARWA
jgi:hypothetical protein